jgi:hypothetical protein
MTRRRVVLLAVTLLATVALGLAVRPAFAGDGSVPFKASYSGSAAMTSQTTVSFNGSGDATHMGRITNLGAVNVTGPDLSCDGGLANTNSEVLTDEHGDTLTIVSQDVACPTAPGVFTGTGRWTVAGGTGRFAGATGQGSSIGGADYTVGTFTMSLDGTVQLPRS